MGYVKAACHHWLRNMKYSDVWAEILTSSMKQSLENSAFITSWWFQPAMLYSSAYFLQWIVSTLTGDITWVRRGLRIYWGLLQMDLNLKTLTQKHPGRTPEYFPISRPVFCRFFQTLILFDWLLYKALLYCAVFSATWIATLLPNWKNKNPVVHFAIFSAT